MQAYLPHSSSSLFRRSELSDKVHIKLGSIKEIGSLIVRVSISASLFVSALTWSVFGPERSLHILPLTSMMRIVLFASSILITLVFATEVTAGMALIVFTISAAVFGLYILTYLNYLGEILALLLFGSRYLSIDAIIHGPLKRFESLKRYQTTIVRICFGLALLYAAISIKILHPQLTLDVMNQYNLTQFHFLFPSNHLLVVLGAALAEIIIALFIAFGFETRFVVLVFLFYMTLSILFFKEAVWPHIMLYRIAINLLIKPEAFTLDNLLFNHRKKRQIERIGQKKATTGIVPQNSDMQDVDAKNKTWKIKDQKAQAQIKKIRT